MLSFSIVFRLFTSFLFLFSYICPIFTFFNKEKRKHIPGVEDRIFRESATVIARKIRRRKITSTEVVSKFIERIKQINPIINALVQDRFQEALEEAEKTDEFLATTKLTEQELREKKPLLGVPMSIKECISVKGMSLACGSLTRVGAIAERDAVAVANLKKAGAIPVCVTNTPEYCFSIETYNLVTGATKNPYNTLHNAGGSSGGEGALIGSGASVCGIGSDIAGSIRIPAAFNGIFGHKPTAGLVDLEGHFPLSSDPRCVDQLTIGPMSRYADDLELITKVIAGENVHKLNLNVPVNLGNLKVSYMLDCGSDFGNLKVHDCIKYGIMTAVNYLKDSHINATISEVKFEDLKYSTEIAFKLHFAIKQDPYLLQSVGVKWQFIRSLLGLGSLYSFNTLLYGLAKENSRFINMTPEECDDAVQKIREEMIRELGDNGVLIYPSFPTTAIPHWGSLYATIGASYLCIFNALGFPATSIPIHPRCRGLPVAIQVIAAPNQDRLCFAVARELERCFGGWEKPI